MPLEVELFKEKVIAQGTLQVLTFAISNVLVQIVWRTDLQFTMFALHRTWSANWRMMEDNVFLIIVISIDA